MTDIVLAVIAIVAAPLSAWLTSVLHKARSGQEVAKLKAEVDQMKSDVRSRELDNDRKSINMVMELVVDPLRKEMKTLQKKIDRLTNAVDKIPSCPHSATCPVSGELQRFKELDSSEEQQLPDRSAVRRGRKAAADRDGCPHGDPPPEP